jgi:hypothetical protein
MGHISEYHFQIPFDLPAYYYAVIAQTSHNIDCALGPLCYVRACSI